MTYTLEQVHDLMRGAAVACDSGVLVDLAAALPALPPEDVSVAFNPKQIASKRWLVENLGALGNDFVEVSIVGGWIGVLALLLLHDRRMRIGHLTSLDIDAACAPRAMALNRRFAEAGRFTAATGDMNTTPVAGGPGRLVINTSAEHIPDPGAWARTLQPGTPVAVQSNDYRAIAEHVSCVDSAEELAAKLGLRHAVFQGALPQKRYTRFMVIGTM
jgi:hypothetical protein